jgi:hypothetical protein
MYVYTSLWSCMRPYFQVSSFTGKPFSDVIPKYVLRLVMVYSWSKNFQFRDFLHFVVQYYKFGTRYGAIYRESFRITVELTPTFVANLKVLLRNKFYQ